MKYLFILLLFLLSSCGVSDQCKEYCKKVEQWTEHCKKPRLNVETCENQYYVSIVENGSKEKYALRCWNLLLELGDEFDCNRIPEVK